MNIVKIIVPSAKILQLNSLNFKSLPPAILPIAGKIVFDYIYESFNSEKNKFEIVVFESKEFVERALLSYKSSNVKINTLDRLSDLGYSIYSAIEDEDDLILINLADTLILDVVDYHKGDTIFYSNEYLSDTWTFFEEKHGVIYRLIDKQHIESKQKLSMFAGLFLITDAKLFKSLLNKYQSKNSKADSFYVALLEYNRHYNFNFIESKKWLDLGHLETTQPSKAIVKSRAFNSIEIDFQRGKIRKTSSNEETLKQEIMWYLEIPREIEYMVPRVFDYSLEKNEMFIELEYYPYNTLHELFVFGNLAFKDWIKIFQGIKNLLDDFGNYSIDAKDSQIDFIDIYIKKTLYRLDLIKDNPIFENYFERPFVINGVKFVSLNAIINIIENDLDKYIMTSDAYRIIHGDLCFSNILVDDNLSSIKLIDPRGNFGKSTIYGDFRYDLAKLLHSFDGMYDFIITDKFDISIQSKLGIDTISFNIGTPYIKYDLLECFSLVFSEEINLISINELRLIESLLFFSMIPLHSDFPSRQLAMLFNAIQLFSKNFDIIYSEEE